MNQFAKGSIEFLTVSVEFCKFIESIQADKADFLNKLSKLLPLIYLKAAMVEPKAAIYDEAPDKYVDENDYEAVRGDVQNLLGDKDQYLTAIHPDIALSDSVIAASISEDIADVYQSLKDFVEVAKTGNEDLMNDALIVCIEDFRAFWGTRLLSAELAIHQIIINGFDEEEEPEVKVNPLLIWKLKIESWKLSH